MPRLHGYRERTTEGVSDKAVMTKTFALIYKDLPKRPERRRTTLPCARIEVPVATLTRWQRFLRTVW